MITVPAALRFRVAAKQAVADGVVALDLVATDGSDLPVWTPGAHIDLQCDGVVRQYSLCGDPENRTVYRVAVRRETNGRGGSRFVHEVLCEGDTIGGSVPRNNFPLVEAKRFVFVAGGIGITPLLPMLAAAHREGIEFRLVYGGRTRASMPFRDQLESWPGSVEVLPEDEVGLIDLDGELASPEPGTAVYCCGPEPLLAAVEDRAAGWHGVTLHVERFNPRVVAANPEADGEFEVELASSGEVLHVPAGRSVLDVLDAAGVPVLSSCQEGTCGTCETPVLSGRVDHRDSLLTDEERAADDVMFVCVSRARSARLVLDL